MDSKTLYIPFANGRSSILAADGTLPCQLLTFMAELLGLKCTDGAAEDGNVFLRVAEAPFVPEDGWDKWKTKQPFAGSFHWRRHPLQLVLEVRPHASWDTHWRRVAAVRRLFSLAVFCQTLEDNDVSLMHGVLLQPPGRYGAALLFGLSGVGKSTMSERFTRQGGLSQADDLSVLTFLPDGRLVAQPAPTWSRVATAVKDSSVDFRQTIPVDILLNQVRGDDDRITAASPVNWRLGLIGGMMEFVSFPLGWLEPELYRMVVAAGGPFLRKCMERFPYRQVEGNLEGHIMDHLNAFLDQFTNQKNGATHETEE